MVRKTDNTGQQGEEEISPLEARRLMEEEEAKRRAEKDLDVEVDIFDSIRGKDNNPVEPVRLKGTDKFCFSCHKGVSCWNECCYGPDITLTPLDILRLAKHWNVRPAEFLKVFTVPAMWHGANMPVAKLRVKGDDGSGPCVFLDTEKGCTVYENRPANCRYYPLGMASVKLKEYEQPDNFHFLVRESHCKGHDENREQTVDEYRQEQGLEDYDAINRGWVDILMKLASWKVVGGPGGKEIDERTKQMFFMATTDVDMFRRFVFESKFLETYDIDAEMVERLRQDDELLLMLGFDWLKNVIFNEPSIQMHQHVLNAAVAKAREGSSGREDEAK